MNDDVSELEPKKRNTYTFSYNFKYRFGAEDKETQHNILIPQLEISFRRRK